MKTVHLVHDGVRVWLSIAPSTAIVEAAAGPFMEPMTVYAEHGGSLADIDRPEQTPLAKTLIVQAVDKAMHRAAGSPRRALIDRRVIFLKSM